MSGKNENVGRENSKVADSDVQGVKAGKHNRQETEAGIAPPPAGESRHTDTGLASPKQKKR